jgi:hypothetical protein
MNIMQHLFEVYMEYFHDILHKNDWVDVRVKNEFSCVMHDQVCKHCLAERIIYLKKTS